MERRVYFLEIMAMKTLLCDVIRVQVPAILFCLPFIHIPRWLPSLLSLSTYRTTRHGHPGLKDHPAFYQLPLGSCPCLTVDSPHNGLCTFTWLTPSFSSPAICSNITSSKQSFPVSHTTSPLQLTLALCTFHWLPSSQFSSIAQKCLTICDPMDCSTPGFPLHHQLPELTQTHVH